MWIVWSRVGGRSGAKCGLYGAVCVWGPPQVAWQCAGRHSTRRGGSRRTRSHLLRGGAGRARPSCREAPDRSGVFKRCFVNHTSSSYHICSRNFLNPLYAQQVSQFTRAQARRTTWHAREEAGYCTFVCTDTIWHRHAGGAVVSRPTRKWSVVLVHYIYILVRVPSPLDRSLLCTPTPLLVPQVSSAAPRSTHTCSRPQHHEGTT